MKDLKHALVLRVILDDFKREATITLMWWREDQPHPVNGMQIYRGQRPYGVQVKGWIGTPYNGKVEWYTDRSARVSDYFGEEAELAATLKSVKKVNRALKGKTLETMGDALIELCAELGADVVEPVSEKWSSNYADTEWRTVPATRAARKLDRHIEEWVREKQEQLTPPKQMAAE